jgi:sugar transferase (PEP-CTERM/EpsH1 system associated)
MRILWLKTELLHPVDKGGRIRTYQMLRVLSREHEITYLTLDDGTAALNAVELSREYCTDLVRVPFHPPPRGSFAFYAALAANLISPLPYAIARYRSPAFEDRLTTLLAERDFDVIVCDFLPPAVNIPEDLQVPSVLFQHNVEAEIWRRHTEVARNPLQRWYFGLQWRRIQRFERDACLRFSVVAAVSNQDAAHFRRTYGVETSIAIPTGVDIDYFRPEGHGPREERHLLFTGSMDWMPNEDGILFFTEHVMPLLRHKVPGIRLSVVGRSPTARLIALTDDHDDIIVTGRVPDVRPWLARASAAVVPLRVGGGTRLKIYEAMAMECPVISTTIGVEGLTVRPGEHLLIADDPVGLANACARLLLDEDRATRIAEAAAHHVRERFGWDRVTLAFLNICRSATLKRFEPAGC